MMDKNEREIFNGKNNRHVRKIRARARIRARTDARCQKTKQFAYVAR